MKPVCLCDSIRRMGWSIASKAIEQQKKLRLIGCAKNVGQSRVAGQIVSTFDKESIAKGETALVLADEQLLFPVLNNLADIETLNITMGAPLSSTPLFTLVDLLLRMQVRYQQYQRGGFTTEMCKSSCAIRIAHTSLSKLNCRQCSKRSSKKTWCL